MPDGVTLFLAAALAVVVWLFRQRFRAVEERLVRTSTTEDAEAASDKLRESLERRQAERDRLAQEDRTRTRDDLGGLEARVRALETTLEETTQTARDDVESLREGLAELKSALRVLSEQVKGLESRLTATGAGTAAMPAGGVGQLVRLALEEQGFERIRLLDAQVEAEAPDGQVVGVEARRVGAAYKGSVRLSQGRVEAVDLRPGYQVFP